MTQYVFDFSDSNKIGVPHGFETYGSDTTFHSIGSELIRQAFASGFSVSRRLAVKNAEAENVEALLRFRLIATRSETIYNNAGLGIFFRDKEGDFVNAYYVACQEGVGRSTTILKRVDGAQTAMVHNTSGFPETKIIYDKYYWLRAQITGTTIRSRWWADGSSEPGGWTDSTTDSAISGTGKFGIHLPGENSMWGIALASFGTDGDPPLAAMPSEKTVSGVVTDETGAPVERIVRAYHRESGTLLDESLSDDTTGAYELTVPGTTGEIDRVVIAEDSGTPGPSDPVLPDLIDRVIPG